MSAGFFFTFGIALIVISFLPSNDVKALFDSFASDGNVESFSIRHIIILRFTGILISVFVGLVYTIRKKILQFVPKVNLSDFLINPKNILDLIVNFIRDLIEAAKKEEKIHMYSFILLLLMAIAIRIYYLNQPWVSDETWNFERYIFHSDGLTELIHLLTRSVAIEHMFSNLLSYLSFMLLGSEQNMWVIRPKTSEVFS